MDPHGSARTSHLVCMPHCPGQRVGPTAVVTRRAVLSLGACISTEDFLVWRTFVCKQKKGSFGFLGSFFNRSIFVRSLALLLTHSPLNKNRSVPMNSPTAALIISVGQMRSLSWASVTRPNSHFLSKTCAYWRGSGVEADKDCGSRTDRYLL